MIRQYILKTCILAFIFVLYITGIAGAVPPDSGKNSSCPLIIGPNRTCAGVGLHTDPQDCSIFIKCFKGPNGIRPYVYYCARNFSFNGLECTFYEGQMPSCIQEQCATEPTKRSKIFDSLDTTSAATVDPTEYGNESLVPVHNVTSTTISVVAASLAKGIPNDRSGSATVSGSFWAIIVLFHLLLVYNST